MKKTKVIVGMSGGVDSSVAAWLLKKQGYDVEGLFMRNWDSMVNQEFIGREDTPICPQEQDYLDAQQVAKQLGIKLHRIDFVKEYWDEVFSYFLSEYRKGRTPNPDILCNKYIKFSKFLDYATHKLGADKIAMGHYAGLKFNAKKNLYEMFIPKDQNKDQTYFLSQLSKEQLAKTIFPLENLTKAEVRALAHEAGLATANKKDSTGICFIGERDFAKFLQNYIPHQNGPIVDIKTKKVLGEHFGVMYYTIGQRKGLNLGGQSEPYYVAKKSLKDRTLYVARASDPRYLLSTKTEIDDVNWINNLQHYVKDVDHFRANAKFRYRQAPAPVQIDRINNHRYLVTFDQPLKAITEGQAAVFYLDNVCLGGGTIDKVFGLTKNSYNQIDKNN